MPRVVSSKAQLEKLVSLMEANQDVAIGVCPKNLATDRWAKIARELNSIGPPVRSDDVWQKVWKDLKYKTKKKMSHNRAELIASGGSPNNLITLSGMEEAISRVMQYNTLYVQPEGLEFGPGQVQNESEYSDGMLEVEEDCLEPSTSQACTRIYRKRKDPTSRRHGVSKMSCLPKAGDCKRKQEKKWTGDETRLFIEMVEEREALWNFKKEIYRNRCVRAKCWEEISVATHHSIADCKYQLNTIISRYNAEQNKIERTKSGQSGFTDESRYEYFGALQFLGAMRNRANRKSTQTNLDFNNDIDNIFETQSSSDSALSLITPVKRTSGRNNDEVQTKLTAMLGELDEFLCKKVTEETAPKKWQQCYGAFVGQELASLSEANGRRLRALINKVIDDFVPE